MSSPKLGDFAGRMSEDSGRTGLKLKVICVRFGGRIHLQAHPQPFPSPLLQFLRLGAREWNGRARAIHGPREPVTPDSNQKRRTLLQFLSDHFHDVQALREYLLQKQASRVNWKNR